MTRIAPSVSENSASFVVLSLPLSRCLLLVPQRLYWWKRKLADNKKCRALAALALLPVRVTSEPRRGEPVTVLLRTGHMLKVSHGFDEDAFARVVALLEAR